MPTQLSPTTKLAISLPTTVTLPVYKLPVVIAEPDGNDDCPKFHRELTLWFNSLVPFVTVDGFYLGRYRLEGYFLCGDCGYQEGSTKVPRKITAKVKEGCYA